MSHRGYCTMVTEPFVSQLEVSSCCHMEYWQKGGIYCCTKSPRGSFLTTDLTGVRFWGGSSLARNRSRRPRYPWMLYKFNSYASRDEPEWDIQFPSLDKPVTWYSVLIGQMWMSPLMCGTSLLYFVSLWSWYVLVMWRVEFFDHPSPWIYMHIITSMCSSGIYTCHRLV